MEQQTIILPGHYESVTSANNTDSNSVREIIRIIGMDSNGYWVSEDNKRYTESDLQHNWVALDTSISQTSMDSHLFRGFKPSVDFPLDGDEDENEEYSITYEPEVVKIEKTVQPSKFDELGFLLSKASIESLNKSSLENLGIESYKPSKITLTLDFEIPYDLSKVRQIIELFNLKPNEVVNYLFETIDYPDAIIKQQLKQLISGKSEGFFNF